MFDAKVLRVFCTVAEELHFGRAAEKLHMTQPGVSQYISSLEKTIGEKLLQRNSRNTCVTPAGEVFLQEAQNILQRMEHMHEKARLAAKGQIGTIRVGVTEGAFGAGVPLNIVKRFKLNNPTISFEFSTATSQQLHNGLDNGIFDVIFGYNMQDKPNNHIQTVLYDDLVCVMPNDHKLATHSQIGFADLKGEAVACYSSGEEQGALDFYESLYRKSRLKMDIERHEVNTLSVAFMKVHEQGAVVICPKLSLSMLPSQVGGVSICCCSKQAKLSMVWHRSLVKPQVHSFVDHAHGFSAAC